MKPGMTIAVAATLISGAALTQEAPPSPVLKRLEHVTIFVRDQEEALRWYVDRLGMTRIEDQRFGPNERWLTIAPPGEHVTHIVLAVPRPELRDSIGHQHNWVFRTGDCKATHQQLTAKGVEYVVPPTVVPWGCQGIIVDLYGNRIVLLAEKPKTVTE